MKNWNLIAQRFKTLLQAVYGERLERVVVFGSYARDEQRPDSDLDVLVVLKDEYLSAFDEIDRITEATFELILETGVDISYHPMTKSQFEKGQSPLLFFIRKEGIAV